jgi:formate dehydrogenase major subunit
MNQAAEAALGMLDKLLAERPERVGHDFSAATRWIAAYRDELIAEWRRTGCEADRRRLGKVNAVLSVVLGGHYPLGKVPWDSIELARTQFASAIATVAGETH